MSKPDIWVCNYDKETLTRYNSSGVSCCSLMAQTESRISQETTENGFRVSVQSFLPNTLPVGFGKGWREGEGETNLTPSMRMDGIRLSCWSLYCFHPLHWYINVSTVS